MKVTKLQLENFRNYPEHTHDFPEDSSKTLLVGENGKGKTNLLEALYILSIGRSFRTAQLEDLIKWGQTHLRCTAEIEDDGETFTHEFFYSIDGRKRKNFKINGVNKRASEYIGHFLTVLFHPEDLNMLYLSPSYRRRYLDLLLSQTDKKYLFTLTNYEKLLKQRNVLLKDIRESRVKGLPSANMDENLKAWDIQLVDFGTDVMEKRTKFVDYLSKNITDIYRSISEEGEDISVKYLCKAGQIENFATKLEEKRTLDIIKGKTTVGPHLDDLEFFIDGKSISTCASRGEFRTLLLAIKLAEIAYIKEKSGTAPILLLDDVFSELDPLRQKHLLNAISDCQTIITATDLNGLEEIAISDCQVIEI